MELVMCRMALVIAFVLALIGPASAQKAEIEVANAKYTEFYNKGDFAGMVSLYTDDAIALPNGSAMVQGRAAIEAMWKGILAEHVGYATLTALDVKPLGLSAAREIGLSA
jgi:ketosteroid isomerase-like protein